MPLQVPQQLYKLLRVPTEPRRQKASAPARDVSRRASRAFSPIPEFSSCIQGVLHEDTVPLPIVGDSGTPAQGVRSLWQTDAIALRMVLRASYGMRGTGLVQMIQNVTW